LTTVEITQSERFARRIDRLVARVARHWLALFNIIVALFVGMPFLAPVLMHAGATGVGRAIYLIYSPTCHQLPERSFFLFGPEPVYSVQELEAVGQLPIGTNILQREYLRWVGSPATGYKVAICERDVAIYGSLLLFGLLFGLWRRKWQSTQRPLPKLPFWAYGLLLVPMLADGLTQLFGLRESDWFLRSLTGLLFGAASVALAYPYVDDAMAETLIGSEK
jgi:uncharacterized membrane protein